MTRILMTADTVGGVWTYALELARALSPQNIEVALATMGAPLSPGQEAEAAQISNLTVYPSAYKLEWMEYPWDDVARAGDWLLALEARLRPDIIHLNGYAHGALPWRAPMLMVGHSCVLSWWRAVYGGEAPDYFDHYRREVRAGLQAAALVAAPTAAMRESLENDYGPFEAAQVIPNGRDTALFAPAPKEPFVLTAGRLWDEAKNIAALTQIGERLSWPVYVAGEQQHPDGGLAEPSGVRLLGCLPPRQLARWLARAAIYALPARYEPFGLSALEAGLSGCALALSDIPSLREVWGDAAVFVPPDEPDALRQAIEDLIADKDRRFEMAARAWARARQYTPRHMADAYLSAYRDLMAREAALCA